MTEANNAGQDRELEAVLLALRSPCPAPQGFADRVLSQAGSDRAEARTAATSPVVSIDKTAQGSAWHAASHRAAWLRSGIAAGVLLAVSFGGWLEHRHQQQVAGEHARQQALLALRIAGSAWRNVQQKAAFPDFHTQTHQENQP